MVVSKITGPPLTLVASNAVAGAGSSWATHGVPGLVVHLVSSGAQALDASFNAKAFHLGGRYAVDGSGMPTGNLQLTIDPIVKLQDAKLDEAVYLSDRVLIFSPHPGTVKAEVRITLSRPRDPLDVEFLECQRTIVRHLGAR